MTGVVVSFDEKNGIGLVRSRALGEDVLVHARVVEGGKPLRAGQRVRFEAEPSEKGPRATRVALRRAPLRVILRWTPEARVAVLVAALIFVLACAGVFGAGWTWVQSWLAAVNPVTFLAFAVDKRRAMLGGRRLSEVLLLGLSLAGGSPAALLAMPTLRHKTQQGAFRLAMGAIVLSQAALAWGLWWVSGK